jgi:hypothetical protein
MFRRKRFNFPMRLCKSSTDTRTDRTAMDKDIIKQQRSEAKVATKREGNSKTASTTTPSVFQIMEIKTWEHGQLRKKLLCLQEKYRAALYLYEVVANAASALEEALVDFDSLNVNPADDVEREPLLSLTEITDNSCASAALGTIIARDLGTARVLETSREKIQASKRMPTPDLSHMIEERARENSQLEQELAYLEKKHRAVRYLCKEMTLVVDVLKGGVHNFQRLTMNTEDNNGTPPTPTVVDAKIARNHGTTMAIEASREKIQTSKRMPTPDLSEIIQERTRQIIQLEYELTYLEEKHGAAEYLYEEVVLVLTSLQNALLSSCKLSTDIGDHK